MTAISENRTIIQDKIRAAAKKAGRDLSTINLVAVSKKQTPARIQEALDAGMRLFGENRVQEAYEHWAALKPSYPGLKLHLIGPLQSNKAVEAVALFDCIETIDRPNLVDALTSEMKKQGKSFPCFIQVNTGAEPQKSGILPADLPDLLIYCGEKGLKINGLMCMPPAAEPPALHFSFLKKLAQRHGLPNLSMGMSGDFEKAVLSGATHIRVGTALFGERE